MKVNKLDQISFWIFLATIFLLPFFFLPFTNFSLGVGKGILLSVGITLSFIFWLIGRFWSGSLVLPKSRIALSGLILVAVFFLAAFFSPARSVSLLGGGFEVGTAGSIALCFMAMFLAINFFRIKHNNFYLYLALSFSFILLFFSVILNLIAGPGSSLAQIIPINLAGSWNDLAIFSGLIVILSLFSIEFLQTNRSLKILSGFILIAALFLLALINFYAAWVVVGLTSLFIFINSFIWRRNLESFKFPAISFTLVIISFIFIIANSLVGGFLSNRLHIDNTEVRPSASATFEVARLALTERPLLGSGPNRFANSWMLFKPDAVNQTALWDANFNYGVGLIPTFAVTTGLLGILAWALFFALFLIAGYKSLSNAAAMNYGSSAIFLSALFLWIFTAIYTPNIVTFALAFVMTGAFIGTLGAERKIKNYDLSLLKDPRLSFLFILILIGITAGSLTLGYSFVKKFASVVYFQKSALSPNTPEGITQAEEHLSNSIFWDQNNDLYYRSLSSLYLFELNNLLSQKEAQKEVLPDDPKAKAQLLLNQAEAAARISIAKDPTNYLNWLSLASVYEQVLPLGVAGSYDNAKQALVNAIALNPKNPGLYVRLAKLEFSVGNLEWAEENAKKALGLRPNDQDLANFLDYIRAGMD